MTNDKHRCLYRGGLVLDEWPAWPGPTGSLQKCAAAAVAAAATAAGNNRIIMMCMHDSYRRVNVTGVT
jgi:hypothetical protein